MNLLTSIVRVTVLTPVGFVAGAFLGAFGALAYEVERYKLICSLRKRCGNGCGTKRKKALKIKA